MFKRKTKPPAELIDLTKEPKPDPDTTGPVVSERTKFRFDEVRGKFEQR